LGKKYYIAKLTMGIPRVYFTALWLQYNVPDKEDAVILVMVIPVQTNWAEVTTTIVEGCMHTCT